MLNSVNMAKNTEIENIRHSFAHLLAAAVQKFYPKVQLGIGPVIENGFYYDFGNIKLTETDLPRIEKEMRAIASQNFSFKKELWTSQKSTLHFKKLKQPFKLELIKDLKAQKVGMVYTGDIFLDLCRGGHVKNTKELPLEGFALTKVAGAYWRGDAKNPMLTRIYGVAFETKEELEKYTTMLREAEARDHKRLGRELGLFVFSEHVGPGLPLYTPKGTGILSQIKRYSQGLREKIGYQLVQTPQINKRTLFELSGHYEKYKDDMFHVRSNYTQEEYFLKPMNCPQHTQIYASQQRSYKDLPVRFADFSLLYRDEKPGELNGLTRLRSFSQDDGHCFCAEDQIEEEFSRVLEVIEQAMKTYNLSYWIRLSLRDEKNKKKYLGSDATWKKSQQLMRALLEKRNVNFKAVEGEAAFYGPKMDLMVQDSLGREWQLSTIQLDLNMPGRFNLEYTGMDGKKYTPVMIHSALVGSPERFFGMLIEHYAGAFPLWLAPEQIWVLPVSDKFLAYAKKIGATLMQKDKNLRVTVREENETLGKKIREGQMQKIPYLVIVGEKEEQQGTISVRDRQKGDLGQTTLEAFSAMIAEQIQRKQ